MNEELLATLKTVFASHPEVVLAYLFGSHVSGNPGPLSDIDIAIVFDEVVPRDAYFKREIGLMGEVSSAIGKDRIDVVNIATCDSPLLKQQAILLGIPIVVRNNLLKMHYQQAILREYEDTKYLRTVQYRMMQNHLKHDTFGNITALSVQH
ncbi:MAG: hypothetical protein A3H59_02465 [Candidatus Jacksonbacteria bacterium RIFCSPLOWO2_02_FULL_43_9]|nr:MAG: Nucleotidyltransferase [Parcubacteria group bacterium GW2011_GWA2_43_13]OGY71113.1 MAG: hypothetical protein A2986_01900 [Candidatus Jacksonbacteria bacterium RIFCSPLOWO2_01_FULL_44_13]OGY72442.1 MAG: hypothetical protein A3H59_02465 [Candidatus Jacksonbacteria bacterium RIFCSPLOWO2_02_FULL_43_9]